MPNLIDSADVDHAEPPESTPLATNGHPDEAERERRETAKSLELALRDETGLAPLDEAKRLIIEARETHDAASLEGWRDQAEAIQRFQARRHRSREVADNAGEIRLRCEAALGRIDTEVAPHGDAKRTQASATGNLATNDPLTPGPPPSKPPLADVRSETRAAWRKLGSLEDEQLDDLTERLRENEDGGLDTTNAVKMLKGDALGVHTSSATPEWGTPQDLFDELHAEFGFTLDVCATEELAKCKRFYTPEKDGLRQKWTGVCFMNPPYGEVIGDWIGKAYDSAKAGATVVCLVPARVDTGWWWDHCRYGEIRFLRGRLRFQGADSSAPFPSAVVIFRPKQRGRVKWWER